jgi:hypothetical protein
MRRTPFSGQDNEKTGIYSTKKGYQVIVEDEFWGERKWWWHFI